MKITSRPTTFALRPEDSAKTHPAASPTINSDVGVGVRGGIFDAIGNAVNSTPAALPKQDITVAAQGSRGVFGAIDRALNPKPAASGKLETKAVTQGSGGIFGAIDRALNPKPAASGKLETKAVTQSSGGIFGAIDRALNPKPAASPRMKTDVVRHKSLFDTIGEAVNRNKENSPASTLRNREYMVATPGRMFEVGVVRTNMDRATLAGELDRADKLAEEAFALASTGDDFDLMEGLSKMEQAARIRQAVGKLLPEFQERIRSANALEKSGFLQVAQGVWGKDDWMVSAGATDYKVARERFQIIKDDILGQPHAGPSL